MGRREEGWDPPTHILFKERRDGGQEARDTKRVTWENHYYVGVSLFGEPFTMNKKAKGEQKGTWRLHNCGNTTEATTLIQ